MFGPHALSAILIGWMKAGLSQLSYAVRPHRLSSYPLLLTSPALPRPALRGRSSSGGAALSTAIDATASQHKTSVGHARSRSHRGWGAPLPPGDPNRGPTVERIDFRTSPVSYRCTHEIGCPAHIWRNLGARLFMALAKSVVRTVRPRPRTTASLRCGRGEERTPGCSRNKVEGRPFRGRTTAGETAPGRSAVTRWGGRSARAGVADRGGPGRC